MARGRRRGPSLLIPMIVLILATLGVTYWATAVAEELEQKQLQLAREQVAGYQLQVVEDEVRVRAEHATEHLGFRGRSAISNPHAISTTLSDISRRSYNIVEIDRPHSAITRPLANFRESWSIGNRNNLVALIHRQDETINRLIQANSSLQQAILYNMRTADTRYFTAIETIDGEKRDRDNRIRTILGWDPSDPITAANAARVRAAMEQLERQREEREEGSDRPVEREALLHELWFADRSVQSMIQQERAIHDVYRNLWDGRSAGMYQTIATLHAHRRELENLRREVAAEMAELEQALADSIRMRTASEHYDGEIWYVDMERRWAYINLGQLDNVKPGMTFDVQRLQRAEQPVRLGMVTVRNVIDNDVSWCEITMLQDENVPMQRGDKIISRNFARDINPRFALVGRFGGEYSRFSRAETEEMLRQAGYRIDPEITRHTDIVVLGVGFGDDSQYARIDGGDLTDFESTYQYWRPADVYYMLGFDE